MLEGYVLQVGAREELCPGSALFHAATDDLSSCFIVGSSMNQVRVRKAGLPAPQGSPVRTPQRCTGAALHGSSVIGAAASDH
jgi:hypothetical protein